ncbi:TIGR03087 family PEP-CTERM/XrtA system glycosyltransferase [Pseudoblastomonas halimionae]|uniref:TIGR03087 family PEP-CTERM/XrtA system glycosyltransferase n=1 Tax=Alteriqipengyuania halimionae TaxID=1926630 RepID=A0A6I4U0C5_9SPHN|nr:TIGR03087 family PEP-CTERM/XrtA system glycosyltransferase [Alteriqipengyuania halimionae]MXP09226.1 TIGR03087 family PEP-CTERM/XrtA system glycosyltransferase [Alteriqipengyuania halimionae]
MGEILFLAHRIPFPPDRGDKIRSHHVLKALAKLAPVHVGCLAESDEDRAHEPELAAIAASHCLATRKGNLPFDGIKALATGRPVSETSFYSRTLQDWVDRTLAEKTIDAIYVFSGQMTAYLPEHLEQKLVIDFVDADSAKFAAYADDGGPMGWVYRREANLVRSMEERFAARADHCLLISAEEAAAFGVGLPSDHTYDLQVIGNGIDAAAFDPAGTESDPLALYHHPRLIFTGQMDYPPNIAAAELLATKILPQVRETVPDATLHIVGRNPTDAVRALESEGVRVWGKVREMRDFLGAADIAVVPLEIARGVQNKVLEAMAMALPCVVSEGAATGIPARNGRDFLVASSAEDTVAAIVALANDTEAALEMGRAARRWTLENASWEAALADLPKLVGMEDAA